MPTLQISKQTNKQQEAQSRVMVQEWWAGWALGGIFAGKPAWDSEKEAGRCI